MREELRETRRRSLRSTTEHHLPTRGMSRRTMCVRITRMPMQIQRPMLLLQALRRRKQQRRDPRVRPHGIRKPSRKDHLRMRNQRNRTHLPTRSRWRHGNGKVGHHAAKATREVWSHRRRLLPLLRRDRWRRIHHLWKSRSGKIFGHEVHETARKHVLWRVLQGKHRRHDARSRVLGPVPLPVESRSRRHRRQRDDLRVLGKHGVCGVPSQGDGRGQQGWAA
mmetsp:Transcript_7316/g.25981  ORF Transcript_7316/g.25981 Transcript_7316/m.25981 type:complete len:222 (-) Transcript_7316:699-1364(-)